ncbi:PaaX family transcriptional regulator [bacterium]|nr:PaaX family transcriptional regulator [bacterium]
MQPSARGLVLDLLSTLRPGSAMPVGALIEAGGLFGISENNVRVATARLLASGHLARDERGAYRLGGASRSIGAHVRTWRDRDRGTRKWSGGWLVVHQGPAARAAQRGRLRALRLFGFAALRPGLWLRPDNLTQPLDAVRRELAALGLPPGDLVCLLAALDDASEARARRLWDVAALRRTYRELGAALTASEARLARLSPAKAMAESFVLGGRALRQLVLDPLLPDVICPPDERDALLEQMRRYDRLGRQAWATLLQRFDVPSLRTPVDSRLDAARGQHAS